MLNMVAALSVALFEENWEKNSSHSSKACKTADLYSGQLGPMSRL